MPMSATLRSFLDQQQVTYELVPHPHTGSSMETAEEAHVPGKRLAKAVILRDGRDYFMVIIPSAEHVDLDALRRQFGNAAEMATEDELGELFPDCEMGAVPPVGAAWSLDSCIDECLLDEQEVFFESGDHEDLVRVSGEQFRKLMGDAKRGHYGHDI